METITYLAEGRDAVGWRVVRGAEQEGPVRAVERRLLGHAADRDTALRIAASLRHSAAVSARLGASPRLFVLVERSFFPPSGLAASGQLGFALA